MTDELETIRRPHDGRLATEEPIAPGPADAAGPGGEGSVAAEGAAAPDGGPIGAEAEAPTPDVYAAAPETHPAGEAGDPAAPEAATAAPDDSTAVPEATPGPEATAGPEATTAASADGRAAEPEPAPAGEPAAAAVAEAVRPLAPAEQPATVAALVAQALRAAGARSAFTVPGESFLPLLDALAAVGIKVVATRHEGGAAFMAAAQAQLTGRPSICLATRAVGGANLAIGIHAALADSAPLIALIGDVRTDVAGREAFQAADIAGSVGRLAAWAAAVDTPADAPGVLAEAVRRALTGRPGPVVVSIPEDVAGAGLPTPGSIEPPRASAPRPSDADVRAVLQLLASAERPVVLAGGGVLRARTSSDLTRLAELLHVPVVAAWRRGDVISNDHPLYLGMSGYGAPACVRERLVAADALLVLGCRLNEIASFGFDIPAAGQPWAHVDLAPRQADADSQVASPTIAVEADARSFVRAALMKLRSAVLDAELVDRRRANNEQDRVAWEAAATVDGESWDGPGVHPGRIITTLRRVLSDEAILTTDAGNFSGWAARGFRFRRPGTFLGPTSGAMGYGLPAAIGAALVHRDRPVVALAGDGGFGMTMAELETAVRERLRVIAIVFDNERYGTIRVHQDRDGREPIGTDLGPVDFAAVARALGGRGIRVETDAAFEPALRQALATQDRPTVIQLSLDRRWRSVDDHP